MQDKNEFKLAFGSCFGLFNQENHIFRTVQESKPDAWLWLGDAVYADNVRLTGKHGVVLSFYLAFRKDNSMPLEYIQGRFNKTFWQKGNFHVNPLVDYA